MISNGEINNSKHALVAGGAGFVGSHLCERLLSLGYSSVTCVDNLSTGSIHKVKRLMDNSRFIFVKTDVTIPLQIDGEITEIYNLACPASPLQYRKNPIQTFKTSVLGSINLLELAHEKNSRILLASTSEVYGNPLVPLQNESYWGNVNPYGLRSCYDEGKRGAETLFHDYHEKYGIDTRIIRIFNTYGPHMDAEDGRVISNFIVQALRGEPLTVYGNGSQTRSFQYIDDLIEGILCAMQDGVCHNPINIGNPQETSVLELGKTIIRIARSTSRIYHQPLPPDDPCQRCPDISLATLILNGWSPQTDLETGLSLTIQYFRKMLGYNFKDNFKTHKSLGS